MSSVACGVRMGQIAWLSHSKRDAWQLWCTLRDYTILHYTTLYYSYQRLHYTTLPPMDPDMYTHHYTTTTLKLPLYYTTCDRTGDYNLWSDLPIYTFILSLSGTLLSLTDLSASSLVGVVTANTLTLTTGTIADAVATKLDTTLLAYTGTATCKL